MKNFVLALTWALLIYSCGDEKQCNYITDYYQLVYKAELHYLKSEYKQAYDLLKQAEGNCRLLNQQGIYEPMLLAELSIRFKKYDEVFPYLERLILDGYDLEFLKNNLQLDKLHSNPNWDVFVAKVPVLGLKYKNRINTNLRAEVLLINQEDQKYRQRGEYDQWNAERIDSINQVKLKSIFKTYGFPNHELIGKEEEGEWLDIGAVLMHIEDTTYFKPILLDYIKRGQCPSRLYGNMIDSKLRSVGEFYYGIYDNVDSTEIKDFKNLDKRRISVGLPPWKMHREKMTLIRKKYGF